MKLLQEYHYDNITGKLYEYKLGYGYKVFTKLKGKTTCVAQSYCYYFERELAYEKMCENMEIIARKVDDINQSMI